MSPAPDSMPTLERLLYSYQGAAEILSVSESTVRRMATAGELEVLHVQGHARITARSMLRYIEQTARNNSKKRSR
jgi:excisionase family DNA binding protein